MNSNNMHLVKDLIQGDDSIATREDFNNIESSELYKTLSIITSNPNLTDKEKNYLLTNSWRLIFREKPPTPEEFLTTEWIGETATNLYDHVKDNILTFLNPNNKYSYLYLSEGIGRGKSVSTAIIELFLLSHLSLMRDPKKYLGIAKLSSIYCGLASFTENKTKQVLLKPFKEILKTSPRYKNVKFEDRIDIVQKEEIESGRNRIVWTTASSTGSLLSFYNDIHLTCVSDPSNLLGLNIITGSISEINFFLKRGIPIDEIDLMRTELFGRIENRFGTDNYYAKAIIDSSPYSYDSPIDKFVFSGEAEQDPRNLVIKGTAHWELPCFEYKYPKWRATKETFKIFVGSAGKPTKLIEDDEDLSLYSPNDLRDVPIDSYKAYKRNPSKFVQDVVGLPSNGEDKLMDDFGVIEKMFDPQLRNIIDSITAPADQNPENLIWDKIKSKFFIEVKLNQYEFYRAPKEKRFITVDQSTTTDVTCISMVHPELDEQGSIVIVTDFTINIVPTKEKINLDAIIEFILDLRDKGHLYIHTVTFDQFQSENGIQKLKRNKINVVNLSVDRDKGPYYTAISYMKTGRLKCGRNIFLKNNYKSLIEVPYERKEGSKVEHTKGKLVTQYNNDWKNSSCGINAKDTTDSQVGAVYMCVTTLGTNYVPMYQYIANITKEKSIENVLSDIQNKFGLSIKRVK